MADTRGYLIALDLARRAGAVVAAGVVGDRAIAAVHGVFRAVLLVTGLASLALVSPVSAQVPAPAIRFTVFASQPIKELAFVPRANATAQKVQFYPTARSPRYEYRGAMPLRFVDETTGAVVAEAAIPAGLRDPLLLFSASDAGAKGGLKYQIAVLDDGAARHGPGGLAIINLSGLALAGTVNGEKVTLQAGLNPTLPAGKSAKIALSTVFKGKTYQAYTGAATLGRNERALLILFPPFYKGALEVQSRLLIDQPPK